MGGSTTKRAGENRKGSGGVWGSFVEAVSLPTEILPSAPKAALKALFFRTEMTLRDVFSAKSISMYRCSFAA
jgi:hypothetical protein